MTETAQPTAIPATAPAPQDHLPAGMFEWTSPGGVTIRLPRMGKLSARLLRETRKLGEEDRMWTLIEAAATPETLALIDSLPTDDLNLFGDEWGKTVGESGRSSI